MENINYWEDLNIGDKFATPSRTVTEALATMLINLAGFTHPMFQSQEFAKNTPLGWLAIPGPLILALMGGLEEQGGPLKGSAIAMLGLENVKIMKPLMAGDTIRVEIEIISKRETKSHERGIIVYREQCVTQREEVVLQGDKVELVRRRPK